MTIFVLNENVKRILKEEPEMLIAFYGLHKGYDDEIEPLHNPDFVKQAKEKEVETLGRAYHIVCVCKKLRTSL